VSLKQLLPLEARRRLKLALKVLREGPKPASSPDDTNDDIAVAPDTTCPPCTITSISACPFCGSAERTLVCEYNKFALLPTPPDEKASRYDYSVCHHCGVLYATLRPSGPRYRWLFEHFEATIGRRTTTGRQSARKLITSAFDLSESDREELREAIRSGVFVSDHLSLSRKTYIPALMAERLSGAKHVELLGSLLNLQGKTVLEIRTLTGSISAALVRLYDVRAHAMALFEHQRFVIEQTYQIPAWPLDYDDLRLADVGQCDLIIGNHILTHAVKPGAFLEAAHRLLAPGGHLYLYNENDEAEFLVNGKSMFNTMNAFHLQTFDGSSLNRALAANGFETVFMTRDENTFLSLSRKTDATATMGLTRRELEKRIGEYLRARDASIVMMPNGSQSLFGTEWEAVVERSLSAGTSRLDAEGRVRINRT